MICLVPKEGFYVPMWLQHRDSPHGLDFLLTHLKRMLGDKQGKQSHENLSLVLQHTNWQVHVPQTY